MRRRSFKAKGHQHDTQQAGPKVCQPHKAQAKTARGHLATRLAACFEHELKHASASMQPPPRPHTVQFSATTHAYLSTSVLCNTWPGKEGSSQAGATINSVGQTPRTHYRAHPNKRQKAGRSPAEHPMNHGTNHATSLTQGAYRSTRYSLYRCYTHTPRPPINQSIKSQPVNTTSCCPVTHPCALGCSTSAHQKKTCLEAGGKNTHIHEVDVAIGSTLTAITPSLSRKNPIAGTQQRVVDT